MSQLMFWSVADDLYNVVELVRTADEKMKTAVERRRPPEDIKLLADAIRHMYALAFYFFLADNIMQQTCG